MILNTSKAIIFFIFFKVTFLFGFSISLTNAPTISKIGGIVTFSGSGFSTGTPIMHIGKVYTTIDSIKSDTEIKTKLTKGLSAKGGIYISNITNYLTSFYQNIPLTTFSGGTAGSITPTMFETQTKVLDFAPSAMVLVDYDNYGYLNFYFADANTTTTSLFNISNNINKPYNIDGFYKNISGINYSSNVQAPRLLKVTELNSNGNLDITCYPTGGNVAIQVNDNSFSGVAGGFLTDYTFVDLDYDNKLDLVYLSGSYLYAQKNASASTNYSFSGSSFNIGFTNGSPPGLNLTSVDFNNDNKQEILVSLGKGSFGNFPNQIAVVSVNSNFQQIAAITTPSPITKIETADLNSDGFHDMVLKYGTNDSLAVVQNLNTGGPISNTSFGTPVLIKLGAGIKISDITTGDVDGDAIPEIIIAYSQNSVSKIRVLKSNFKVSGQQNPQITSASYSVMQDYTTDSFFNTNLVLGLEVADINADGKNDIVGYGGNIINPTTTLGMFLALINKSCEAPDATFLTYNGYACSTNPYSIEATVIGTNITYGWVGSVYNTTTQGYDFLDLAQPFYKITNSGSNPVKTELDFTPTVPENIEKQYALTVDGTCGATFSVSHSIYGVLQSPAIVQKTVGLCNQPLLSFVGVGATRTVFGDWNYNGLPLYSDNQFIDSIYKPILSGKYKAGIYVPSGAGNTFCLSNEIEVPKFTPTLTVSITQNTNYSSMVLAGLPNNTYKWYINGRLIANQTTETLNTNYKGSYLVEQYDKITGCKAVSQPIVIDNPNFFESPTGRGELILSLPVFEFSYVYYPNPVDDMLHINLTGSFAKSSIKLYDNLGKVVSENNLFQSSNIVDVSYLSSGIYSMQIYVDNKMFNHKIVIF